MYQGINQAIAANETGAVANFHRIEYYSVDLKSHFSTLVVNGYVSQETFANNKQALVSTNVTINSIPSAGTTDLDYFYEQIILVVPPPVADPNQPHIPVPVNMFAGAELIPT